MLLEESVCVDVIGSETRKDSPKKGSNNGREVCVYIAEIILKF